MQKHTDSNCSKETACNTFEQNFSIGNIREAVVQTKGTFSRNDKSYNKKLVEKNELVAYEEIREEERNLPNIHQNY